jgi:hypothetical protein
MLHSIKLLGHPHVQIFTKDSVMGHFSFHDGSNIINSHQKCEYFDKARHRVLDPSTLMMVFCMSSRDVQSIFSSSLPTMLSLSSSHESFLFFS